MCSAYIWRKPAGPHAAASAGLRSLTAPKVLDQSTLGRVQVGVEVLATDPQQVVFAELELAYAGCGSEGTSVNEHRGSEELAAAHPIPALSLLQSRAYCPTVRTPTFCQRLAPFTASAILPGTGQVGGK